MAYFIQSRWGDSEDAPTEARMREILAELDTPDPEHPGPSLTHETGWYLSVDEGGRVIWENPELPAVQPRYQDDVSRDEVLRMWLLLSRGAFDEIESLPWLDGYGPPISAEEMQKIKQEAAEITFMLDRRFYDRLGPEDVSRPCRHDGCSRGSLKCSLFCRPHHFESLYKRQCPFEH